MSETTVTVLFFARLREELETDRLTLPVSPGDTVGDVLSRLAARGGRWAQLQGDQPVMIAVNQTMARPGTALSGDDEVAFFPPVTGG
ncbi:molybdopterin converting factor subunit 1 [Marinobacter oulmenensis]|uniref:Molybdopterin synthase sulfur carrier subunit n=1 Tax=Marinobacter oulmenensis TaxID=643747 RepID=A0A840UIC9_9GAMM|nr:molybdopterin converting factor subunit 1 [Marinobacter oulmenensis]MBB5320886.1 molybdopterin synthase sulfur carrier subunit [Marinobacter oulmenensis]